MILEAIVKMLTDPKEASDGIREVHIFPFNQVDKRIALTYINAESNWLHDSKGAPKQEEMKRKVHGIIDKFTECGFRSLAAAGQVCPKHLQKQIS